MNTVVVRLCDMGCIQNALPVAKQLISDGVSVCVYRDPGSIAEEKIVVGFTFIDEIPSDTIVVSCLPLGLGFATICENQNPVVLIQENPDPSDSRFANWLGTNVQMIVTLAIPSGFSHMNFLVTGLPAIDEVIDQITKINLNEVKSKIGLQTDQYVVVLSLPGDSLGANRMLDLVEKEVAYTDHVVIARSHPKLKRNDHQGYEMVKNRVDSMSSFSLEDLNSTLGPLESIALAIGDNNHFVGTHDTTMNWQAAAAGVFNVQVMPPATDVDSWAEKSPIITTTFGRVFDGRLVKHKPNRSFVINDAASTIARLVREYSCHIPSPTAAI